MAENTSTGTYGQETPHGNGSTLTGGLTGTAGAAAAGLMNQVKSRASSQVAAQQARAAEGLGTVASALRRAGDELRPRNESLASYADMAVDELEHLSSRIRDKEPGDYLNDLEDFARRRPTTFVAGAFVVGLALARFLKSTQASDARARRYGTRGYGGDYAGGYRSENGPFRGHRGTQPWPESTGTVTPPAPGRTPTPTRNTTAAATGASAPTAASPLGSVSSSSASSLGTPGVGNGARPTGASAASTSGSSGAGREPAKTQGAANQRSHTQEGRRGSE